MEIANKIGYPVLVRPSYVLGGRAMEIVHNDDDLRIYMATAVKEISHDAPILVDKYIVGKECEVDAICDGKNVYIPGIMEHIERAGIHSGDSISVYPAPTILQKVKDDIISYTIKIGKGFKFIGLFNIQFMAVRFWPMERWASPTPTRWGRPGSPFGAILTLLWPICGPRHSLRSAKWREQTRSS